MHPYIRNPAAIGRAKNKVEKNGVFFVLEFHGVFCPQSPRIPPRSHQQITITKHLLFLEPPSKTSIKRQRARSPWLQFISCKIQKLV
jgi:hypothetical protein